MNKHSTHALHRAGLYALVALFAAAMVLPFLWMVLLSFKTDMEIMTQPLALPAALGLENYTRALETLDLFGMYMNTLLIVLCTVLGSLLVTFLSSFCISRMVFKNARTPGRLYLFFLLGLAVPVYILLFPIYRIAMLLGILDTHLGLIIPYIAVNISFNTLLFVGFLRDFPAEMEEAAIIDGCGLFRLCYRVVAPLMKSIFATVTIFNIIYAWNEFPFASTFLTDATKYTVSLMTAMFKGRYSMDYSGIVAAAVMIIIPQLVFYALFQKRIIGGLTEGAVKG